MLPRDVVHVSIREVWADVSRWTARLGREERATFEALTVEKRARDWLAGRVAAKRAVQRALGLPFSAITIATVAKGGPDGGRPYAMVGTARHPTGWLSITHTGDLAAACFADAPVGLDVEQVEARGPELEALAFTAAEREVFAPLVDPERSISITRAWCLKEARAKQLGCGLRAPFATLSIPPSGVIAESGLFEHAGAPMAWARVLAA